MKRILLPIMAVLLFGNVGLASGRLDDLRLEQGGDGLVEIHLTGRDLPAPQIVRRNERTLTLRLADCRSAVKTPITTPPLLWGVEQIQNGTDLELALRFRQPLDLTLVEADPGGRSAFIRLTRPRAPAAHVPATEPAKRGSTLTLDLKDASLSDALRLVARGLRRNIVIDPTTPATTVTALLRDVTAQEALEFLTSSADLGWAELGRTIVVGPKATLSRRLGKLGLECYQLHYGDPTKLAPMVKNLIGLDGDDAVVVDERQRRLYITATPAQHARITRLVRQLDEPAAQVMIRTRIVEVSDDATAEMETLLEAVYHKWWLAFSGGLAAAGVYNGSDKPTSGALIPDAAGTTNHLLDVRIAGLVGRGKAHLLADPTVVVIDGHKATIKLVDRVKYVSYRDEAGNPTYSDEEVGPRLEVTPFVGADGQMTIQMELRTGEIVQWKRGGLGEEVPQISEREVRSSVRVSDGQPFVVGGLFKRTESVHRHRVPLLGDLPLFGSMFRSSRHLKSRSQVIMVVIPTLLPPR